VDKAEYPLSTNLCTTDQSRRAASLGQSSSCRATRAVAEVIAVDAAVERGEDLGYEVTP
jgi:hypothetical protein